jgi:hypothetical protein
MAPIVQIENSKNNDGSSSKLTDSCYTIQLANERCYELQCWYDESLDVEPPPDQVLPDLEVEEQVLETVVTEYDLSAVGDVGRMIERVDEDLADCETERTQTKNKKVH